MSAYDDFIRKKSQIGHNDGFEPLWLPDALFDFQRYATDKFIRKGRAAAMEDCGLGKALRIDQRILVRDGWLPIGDAQIGMQVYGSDGMLHDIIGVYPQGIRELVTVYFSDGTSVVCDRDHLWTVKSQGQIYHGRPGRTLTTAQIEQEGIDFQGGQKRHFVPLVMALYFGPECEHFIDPYTLGVVLGDGGLTGNTVSVTKPDFTFSQDELPLPRGCSWSDVTQPLHCKKFSIIGGDSKFSENPFTVEIRRLGLHGKRSEEKFIPPQYLFGSAETRIAVLQGLLDTDGSTTGSCIEFSTSSPRLSEDIIFLVRSLGGTATHSCESAHYTKDGQRIECLDKHRSILKLPAHIEPFRLERKRILHAPVQRKNPLKSIVGIENAGTGDAICIRVDSADRLFVTEGMTLTHNSLQGLVWSQNIVRKTNGNVLVALPLAILHQMEKEGEKFGVECKASRDGKVHRGITITNFEQLDKFDAADFSAMWIDEAGILKSVDGKTRKICTRMMSKLRYRLLSSATPAPNDYIELSGFSEALGELSDSEMKRRFFQQCDDKKQRQEQAKQDQAEAIGEADPNYFKKLAYRISQTIGQWRLRHHAVKDFWRWVASWSVVCRKPSDLGFDDGRFVLPPLIENDHVIEPRSNAPGRLFNMPAIGLQEEREERHRTLNERCEFMANLVDHKEPAVVWVDANEEGDLMERLIPGALQIAGKTNIDRRLEIYDAFASGELRVLVIKKKIGAWGANWQHCAHSVQTVSHSYEADYQLKRRFWRFGQLRAVRSDTVCTEGEIRVLGNVRRKEKKSAMMFEAIVAEMNQALKINRTNDYTKEMELPNWLQNVPSN